MKVALPIPVTTTAVMQYTNAPASPEAAWFSATTYSVGQRVQVGEQRIYEALATTLNDPPATSPAKWLYVGASNPWRPFDGVLSTAASGSAGYAASTFNAAVEPPGWDTGLAYRLVMGAQFDMIVAMGLKGRALDVYIRSSDNTQVLFKQRYVLDGSMWSADWWNYVATPPDSLNRVAVLFDWPIPANANIAISVVKPISGEAELGSLLIGSGSWIGDVVYPAEIGDVDYSVIEEDPFGGVTLIPRSFSARAELTLTLPESYVPSITRRLLNLRATPAVWVPDSNVAFSSAIIYGYRKRFSMTYQSPGLASLSLSLRGMV